MVLLFPSTRACDAVTQAIVMPLPDANGKNKNSAPHHVLAPHETEWNENMQSAQVDKGYELSIEQHWQFQTAILLLDDVYRRRKATADKINDDANPCVILATRTANVAFVCVCDCDRLASFCRMPFSMREGMNSAIHWHEISPTPNQTRNMQQHNKCGARLRSEHTHKHTDGFTWTPFAYCEYTQGGRVRKLLRVKLYTRWMFACVVCHYLKYNANTLHGWWNGYDCGVCVRMHVFARAVAATQSLVIVFGFLRKGLCSIRSKTANAVHR